MNMKSLLIILGIIFSPASLLAESLYSQFPSVINANEKYVFYSHGLIVEGTSERPIHPEYGRYEYPLIRQALFELGEFNLIAHHRAQNTDVDEYANRLKTWVLALIDAGVKPSNITLIGFSRGALLTALAANQLHGHDINTVLMASCFQGDISANPPVSLSGRLLSIYESTDTAGSCEVLASRSQLKTFDEIYITTGKKHGAFYVPLDIWLEPIQQWLQ